MSVKRSVNALKNFAGSVGCFVKGGKLTLGYRGVGVRSNCPTIRFAAYSHTFGKVFLCSDSELYEWDGEGEFIKKSNMCAKFMFEYINGVNTEVIMVSDKTAVVYTGTAYKTVAVDRAMTCGLMHCGRVFGGNGLVVRWSGINGVTDWSGGVNGSGYVKFDPDKGKVLNVLEFNGKIVAVREYGLTVFSAYGAPENFSVDITDTACDKIYKNTACVAEGKLYFYTLSGLKCFDGVKINSVYLKHTLSNAVAAVAYTGEYFISGKSQTLNRNVILCVRLSDNESCIIDDNADAFFIKDGVYFCNADRVEKLVKSARYSFVSSAIDFGTGKSKTVTGIDVQGKADVRISCEGKTHLYYNASGVIRPHMRGKNFIVEAAGSSALKGITVTAEVTDGI